MSIHLVHRFKFAGDLAAGATLAGVLARILVPAQAPDALIPVPLSTRRRRSRGFDQALELARLLGRSRRIEVLRGAARRVRDHAPQSTLTGWNQRWRNVRDVFHVKPGTVSGAHVGIVDDVMTSGATVHALALELLEAGATRVDLWVACRAGLGE